MTPDQERALGYWRRQLVLTFVTVAVGTGALRLTAMSLDREAEVASMVMPDGRIIRDTSYVATLWPAVAGVAAVAVVSVFVAIHAIRVAAFTFRKGDS